MREELLDLGEFGDLAVDLLYQLVDQEWSKVVPRLRGSERWAAAEPIDVAHAFFAEKGRALTTQLIAEATDDDSVGRVMRKAIQRWLIDEARKTDEGARYRRLAKVLGGDPERFEQVPDGQPGAGQWRLRGATGVSGTPLRDLIAAAWTVSDVYVPSWTSDDRRPPIADHDSLVRILGVVLAAAGGSVSIAVLVRVFSDRLPIGLDPVIRPLQDSTAEVLERAALEARTISDPAMAITDVTAAEVVTREATVELQARARQVYDELTAGERKLLPALTASLAERSEALGLGRSQTHQRTHALRVRLRALIGAEPGAERRPEDEQVLVYLTDFCSGSRAVTLSLDPPMGWSGERVVK